MYKNIIYIGYAPLTTKTSKDFYIADLLDNGINLTYWDMSGHFFPWMDVHDALDEQYIKKVGNLMTFNALLRQTNLTDSIFFINFPYTGLVIGLFRYLTKHNASIAIIARGALPFVNEGTKKSVSAFLKEGLFKKIKSVLLNRSALLLKNAGFIKPFDRIYYAGEEAVRIAGVGYQMDLHSSQLIPINSVDYDASLSTLAEEKLVEYEYAVFLDAYLPHHPDTNMFKVKTVDPDDYYSSLNVFFEKIENEFKVKVVIAAHPKAKKYKEENSFHGRDVYFYKTVELIKYAKFVLVHCSTAISFAVLFNKRIIFFYSEPMKQLMWNYFNCICSSAQSLDSALINISEPYVLNENIMRYNQSQYDNYKYKYLTSKESENQLSSIVFINSLKFS